MQILSSLCSYIHIPIWMYTVQFRCFTFTEGVNMVSGLLYDHKNRIDIQITQLMYYFIFSVVCQYAMLCFLSYFGLVLCTATHCPELSFATLVTIPRSAVGTSITASCKAGYDHISIPSSVNCQVNGAWTTLPTCQGQGTWWQLLFVFYFLTS